MDTKEDQKLSYQEQKEFSKRISKLRRDILKLEEKMDKISEERKILSIEYEDAGRKNDVGRLVEIQEEFDRLDEEEISKMEEWDSKSHELSELEGGLI